MNAKKLNPFQFSLTWLTLMPVKMFHSHPCDQIGQFLKVVGDRFSYKRGPNNNWWLFGLFRKTQFWRENCCGYILGNFCMNLKYFLFQHLITLNFSHKIHKSRICSEKHFLCVPKQKNWEVVVAQLVERLLSYQRSAVRIQSSAKIY